MNSLVIEEQLVEAKNRIYSEEELTLVKQKRVPHHIAIIMDGNRRWAKMQGLPPMFGHWKGAEVLTSVVRAASELGVKVLTVYAFSTENWGRSFEEVDALMHLFNHYLISQRESMVGEGVRLEAIGDLKKLPLFVKETLAETKEATAGGTKIDLILALNYGGRDDIRRAVVSMVEDYENGRLLKEQISEEAISRYLDTAKWPDPDILVRTSGEKRQSNFLLWQLSYSEFYHTEVLWPDFTERDLLLAVREFQSRERRLGKA